MPMSCRISLNVQTLKSLDDRELEALMSVVDLDSITDGKVREELETRSQELVLA